MGSLVVLQHHLRLTLTEMRDSEKVHFLDEPISPMASFVTLWVPSQISYLRHRSSLWL